MEVLLEGPERMADVPSVRRISPAHQGSERTAIRVAIWIFLSFQFFYLLTSSGRARTADEYNTYYMAESLVLRGSTEIPQAVQLHNFYGKFDLQGKPRAAYPPGQALLSTPWYAFGHYVVANLPGVPIDMSDLVSLSSTCLSSATFAALADAFFFALLCGIGISVRTSLFATAIVGFATPMWGYSAWLFSEPLSSAIFMGVTWWLFGRGKEPISIRAAAVAGLTLGLATWVRPTNALAIGILAIALLLREGKAAWRQALVLCASAAVGPLALVSRNHLLFGSPFDFGYPKTVDYGIHADVRFDTPLSVGLYGFLLSPGKSVFLFAPPTIIALAGLRRLWSLDRGVGAVALLFPFVYLLFFSRYSSWEGGYCVGPRYLVPSVALLCLGLGPFLDAGRGIAKRIGWFALALGAAVQLITMATSFLEDEATRGHYYDSTWHYRLDYSLRGPLHLFWKYLTTGQPARLGLGWDRWFVFLHIAGVSTATLASMLLLMLLGFAFSLTMLIKKVRVAA